MGKWLKLALGFAPLVVCWHVFYAWQFHALFPSMAFTAVHYYSYSWMQIPHYHWYFYDFFLLMPLFTFFGALVMLQGGWRLAS